MAYTSEQTQPLTVKDFLAQYSENPRYELTDGELIDIEPTGSHETVAGKLAAQIGMAIAATGQPWFVPRTCLVRPFSDVATARRPNVISTKPSSATNRCGSGNPSSPSDVPLNSWWKWSVPTGQRTTLEKSRNTPCWAFQNIGSSIIAASSERRLSANPSSRCLPYVSFRGTSIASSNIDSGRRSHRLCFPRCNCV